MVLFGKELKMLQANVDTFFFLDASLSLRNSCLHVDPRQQHCPDRDLNSGFKCISLLGFISLVQDSHQNNPRWLKHKMLQSQKQLHTVATCLTNRCTLKLSVVSGVWRCLSSRRGRSQTQMSAGVRAQTLTCSVATTSLLNSVLWNGNVNEGEPIHQAPPLVITRQDCAQPAS